MSTIVVHNLPEEDSMTISFSYDGKQRNMKRAKEEVLGKSLKRISLSISQSSKKKSKKEKKDESLVQEEAITVSLWLKNEELSHELKNEMAWRDGSVLKLGEQMLSVEVNPPCVTSLTLPSHIMIDFPIFPAVELQFATVNACEFQWHRSVINPESCATASPQPSEFQWEKVCSNSFFYKPLTSDIGCYLKLVCIPGREGKMSSRSTEAISSVKVSAGPGFCQFENRHLYTGKILDKGSLRVISYNILADMYSREDFAVNILYPYCPPYALAIGYREQLILREITGYNGDILCLQECGVKIFTYFLERAMSMLGYKGLLRCKAGEVPEGEAIFFNQEKLEFVGSHDIVIKDELIQEPLNGEILDHVSTIPALLETLTKRNSVAQVTVLRDLTNNSLLCVVNTHLYYKPRSPHVRLIQAAVILNHIKKLKDVYNNPQNSIEMPNNQAQSSMAVIFCGDLNSNPRSGLIELLSTGFVDSNHIDWTACENQEEHCQTLSLSHQFDFTNASGFPPYTNYTLGYKGTLDYIFYETPNFDVDAVVPVPSEDELMTYSALPSVVSPSDHIALVCDLKWKQ